MKNSTTKKTTEFGGLFVDSRSKFF